MQTPDEGYLCSTARNRESSDIMYQVYFIIYIAANR